MSRISECCTQQLCDAATCENNANGLSKWDTRTECEHAELINRYHPTRGHYWECASCDYTEDFADP